MEGVNLLLWQILDEAPISRGMALLYMKWWTFPGRQCSTDECPPMPMLSGLIRFGWPRDSTVCACMYSTGSPPQLLFGRGSMEVERSRSFYRHCWSLAPKVDVCLKRPAIDPIFYPVRGARRSGRRDENRIGFTNSSLFD